MGQHSDDHLRDLLGGVPALPAERTETLVHLAAVKPALEQLPTNTRGDVADEVLRSALRAIDLEPCPPRVRALRLLLARRSAGSL